MHKKFARTKGILLTDKRETRNMKVFIEFVFHVIVMTFVIKSLVIVKPATETLASIKLIDHFILAIVGIDVSHLRSEQEQSE